MQHTVIAFFDTYPQAEAALDALIAAGLARDDIALQARCEPTYASDATPGAEARPPADEGLLASIEQFFESLFASREPPHETAQYAEAVRRGAVMLSVDVATDDAADLARTTLEGMGPIDIEARAATWHAPSEDSLREHSPLEELGLRRITPAATRHLGAVRSYARDPRAAAAAEVGNGPGAAKRSGEAEATAVAAGSAAGMGAVFTSGSHADAPPTQAPGSPAPAVPDEYLQNEEFHTDDSGNEDERKR
jgi:hypothetical protein